MEILTRLKDWFAQSGAPWRPYATAVPSPDLTFARPGGVSRASSVRTEGLGRGSREVAANDGARRASTQRGAARSPHFLITAGRVTGAVVICGDDRVDCRIRDLSIDKKTGRIDTVLVAFSGFLGLSEKIYPLPWRLLTYDPTRNAFRIPFNGAAIRAAPSLSSEELEWFGAGDEAWRAVMAQSYWPYLTPPI